MKQITITIETEQEGFSSLAQILETMARKLRNNGFPSEPFRLFDESGNVLVKRGTIKREQIA